MSFEHVMDVLLEHDGEVDWNNISSSESVVTPDDVIHAMYPTPHEHYKNGDYDVYVRDFYTEKNVFTIVKYAINWFQDNHIRHADKKLQLTSRAMHLFNAIGRYDLTVQFISEESLYRSWSTVKDQWGKQPDVHQAILFNHLIAKMNTDLLSRKDAEYFLAFGAQYLSDMQVCKKLEGEVDMSQWYLLWVTCIQQHQTLVEEDKHWLFRLICVVQREQKFTNEYLALLSKWKKTNKLTRKEKWMVSRVDAILYQRENIKHSLSVYHILNHFLLSNEDFIHRYDYFYVDLINSLNFRQVKNLSAIIALLMSNIPKTQIDILKKLDLSDLFDRASQEGFYKFITHFHSTIKHPTMLLESFQFRVAYAYGQIGHSSAAFAIYAEMVRHRRANASVFNNIGVIYEAMKQYKEAVESYYKAIELDDMLEVAKKNLRRIEKTIEGIEKQDRKLVERYFHSTGPRDKRVLFSVYRLTEMDEKINLDVLRKVTSYNDVALKKHVQHLLKLGLLNEDWSIPASLRENIKVYIDPQVDRQIIRVSANVCHKPIFFHESEITLYRVLTELFPSKLVFPNISLTTIIDAEKIRPHLSKGEMSYFFKAHADFAIIDPSTYVCLLALEKDSKYNDTVRSIQKSKMKNHIFEASGLHLVRLRFHTGLSFEQLKKQIEGIVNGVIADSKQGVEL